MRRSLVSLAALAASGLLLLSLSSQAASTRNSAHLTPQPAHINFGRWADGTGTGVVVTFTNTSSFSLTVDTFAFADGAQSPPFLLGPQNCTSRTFAPGDTCTAELEFVNDASVARGNYSGTFELISSAYGVVSQVRLRGSAL